LLCRYCLALGNVIDQLDAQQSVTQDDEAIKKGKRQYADWVALRWKVSKDDTSFGPPDIEARKKLCLPKPFNWASEEDHRIKNEVLREIIEEFLIKSSAEMSELFEGCATTAIQNMDINESPDDSSIIDPRSMSPKSTSQVTFVDRSGRSPSPPAAAGLTATTLAPSSSPGNSPASLQKRQSLAEIAKVSKIGSIGQFSSLNDMEDYNCRRHRVRSLAARIGAVATGLTARIPDFNEDSASADLAIHGEMPG
jgi:cell division septation protein DedD